MSFTSLYPQTCATSGLDSMLRHVCRDAGIFPAVGVYGNGLMTILDESIGRTLLDGWRWLLGDGCAAVMTTGFGDVFYVSEHAAGIHFLEVQRGTTEFVDTDAHWVLDEFLGNPLIVENVLKRPLFEQLIARIRPLRYRETFILQPWLMLGGTEDLERFTVGDCHVYLDLVGQTLEKQ